MSDSLKFNLAKQRYEEVLETLRKRMKKNKKDVGETDLSYRAYERGMLYITCNICSNNLDDMNPETIREFQDKTREIAMWEFLVWKALENFENAPEINVMV